MSLTNVNSSYVNKCENSRLSLAIERLHTEVSIETFILKRRYKSITTGYYQQVKKSTKLQKKNYELRLKLAIKDIIIKEYQEEIQRFNQEYSNIENLRKYCAILEKFIRKNTVPRNQNN